MASGDQATTLAHARADRKRDEVPARNLPPWPVTIKIPARYPAQTKSMERRVEGRLKSWNAERGFGFVAVDDGEPIFVHVSEFPRGGPPPTLDEPLSFEVASRADGKKRAVKLMRHSVGRRPAVHRVAKEARRPARRGGWGRVVAAVIVICVAVLTFRAKSPAPTTLPTGSGTASFGLIDPRPASAFERRCDGRTHCAQMTSCEEARFFLQNCPGVQMDGNNDGEPCESQWCN